MALPARFGCFLLGLAMVADISLLAQKPSFRANVDLITLAVSVTDRSGHHIGDLSAGDFEVFEDGRPQELDFFAPANTALSIALLMDSSSSMEESMPLAQRAAMEFVSKLRSGDVAEIVDFDSRVQVIQPLTSDRNLLEAAIQRTRAGGSTALFNAVYITLREFDRVGIALKDDVHRNVIVVLSDGEDTSSLVTFDEVLDLAKRSQTVIYTISLGAEQQSTTKPMANGEFALRRLAQETGGRLFTASRAQDLSNVYTQIADELSSQYVLGYLSRNDRRDGGWRTLSVILRRPQLQARTRTGYYAASR